MGGEVAGQTAAASQLLDAHLPQGAAIVEQLRDDSTDVWVLGPFLEFDDRETALSISREHVDRAFSRRDLDA